MTLNCLFIFKMKKQTKELIREERKRLYSQIRTSVNGVSVPVNRQMTMKERVIFRKAQPEWCQWIWSLKGHEYLGVKEF